MFAIFLLELQLEGFDLLLPFEVDLVIFDLFERSSFFSPEFLEPFCSCLHVDLVHLALSILLVDFDLSQIILIFFGIQSFEIVPPLNVFLNELFAVVSDILLFVPLQIMELGNSDLSFSDGCLLLHTSLLGLSVQSEVSSELSLSLSFIIRHFLEHGFVFFFDHSAFPIVACLLFLKLLSPKSISLTFLVAQISKLVLFILDKFSESHHFRLLLFLSSLSGEFIVLFVSKPVSLFFISEFFLLLLESQVVVDHLFNRWHVRDRVDVLGPHELLDFVELLPLRVSAVEGIVHNEESASSA